MRAVLYDNYGGPEALHLADIPAPAPGPGQLQIRVKAASVNPADAKWRAGMFKDFMPIQMPHIPGYDIAGTVEAVGAGVSGFNVGDRVAGLLENTIHGGYAEMAALAATACAKLPDSMDFAVGASLPVVALTAAQMIEEHIKPAKGETILVTGALGAVGRFIVHVALAHGAKVVAAVRPSQAAEAKKLGASHVIGLDGSNAAGVTYDHVADTIGGPQVTALCKPIKAGKYICTAATDPIDPAGLAVTPVMVFLHQDGARLAEIIKDVAAGKVTLPIARRLPLTAANAAEAQNLQAKGGLGGKIILEP